MLYISLLLQQRISMFISFSLILHSIQYLIQQTLLSLRINIKMKQIKSQLKESKLSSAGNLAQLLTNGQKYSKGPVHQKGLKQATFLDLKKINLSKNLEQSNSSLQLLILLLSRCLKMSVEQILGLFTNQNKYLAHIIVKGVNEQFRGIREFYSQLNQNMETIHRLYQQDIEDTYACLYSLKPGFISKDLQVAELTILFFSNLQPIYHWFVREDSKCSNTLFLGFRRHQTLAQKYISVLFSIIQGNQLDFFINYYLHSLSSPVEVLTVAGKLARYLSERTLESGASLQEQLQKGAVYQHWLQLGQHLFQSTQLEDKLAVLQFLSQLMLWLPKSLQKNQTIFNAIKQNWANYQMIEFVPLFDQMLIILQRMAQSKNTMSRKIYNIILDIFNDTYFIEDKKQFIVNAFVSLIPQFPSIPADLFIKKYSPGKLNASDFYLICQAIDITQDSSCLIKICQTLKDIFFYDVVTNYYLGNLIIEIVRKLAQNRSQVQQQGTLQFLTYLVRVILSNYMGFVNKLKSITNKNNTGGQQTVFGKKVTLQKSARNQRDSTNLLTQRREITMNLCQRIINVLLRQLISQTSINTIKDYMLMTNLQIKRSNYGTGDKRISSMLLKRFGVNKQGQVMFQDQNKQVLNKHLQNKLSQSIFSRRSKQAYAAITSLSRVQVPQRVTKQFDAIITRRKQLQQTRQLQQAKRKKQHELKQKLYKKQIEKMSLIRGGFGQGQAQLKEEGFWNKLVKDSPNSQLKVFTHEQIQDAYLQSAEIVIRKYGRLFRYFFFNYSNTMYAAKTTNFDQNMLRKQTLTSVQITKFLKDYRLIFNTNSVQIQDIVRDINVKILHRKEIVNQLDYDGFEEFVKQFCLCIWTRGNQQNKNLDHLNLPQLISNLIQYLKDTFRSKNQNMGFFEANEPQIQKLTPQIIQFNQMLSENPNYILPQGFKKIFEKSISFQSSIKQSFSILESYNVCLQVFDEIVHQKLAFHITQPHVRKMAKVTVKPFHQVSVRDRDPNKIRARALSTVIDRKMSMKSSLSKLLTKNDLSKGIKKAMLLLKNEDKIVGEQVALSLEEMLHKISLQPAEKQGKERSKLKSLQIVQNPNKRRVASHNRFQSLSEINSQIVQKSQNHAKNLQNIKKQLFQKRRKRKQQEEKRQEQKMTRKKQQQDRYYQQQKRKVQQKKRLGQQQVMHKKQNQKQARQQKKRAMEKFQQFNQKNVHKLRKEFVEATQLRKKNEQSKQVDKEQKQQKMRKVRAKIQTDSQLISQIRKQTIARINQIYQGQEFQSLVKQYQLPLRMVFEYLQKQSFNPLADKICKPHQIDFDTWLKFNKLFEISPIFVSSKDLVNIFKAVTKDKRVTKQYVVGLTFQQFLQSLLRECIKQKTIFSKLSLRIKQIKPSPNPTANNKKQKPTAKVQLKNQFQEQDEQVDIKKLLKQPDVRDDITDHYGDISKFNIQCLKGLIYYLRMPFTKKGQETRMRELIQNQKKTQNQLSNIQRLKQKLKAQYTLQRHQQKQKTQVKVQSKEINRKIQAKKKKLQGKG